MVNPAKTAEPIEMPLGLWARLGRRNHVLDGGPEVLRDVAMKTIFGFFYIWSAHWCHPCAAAMLPYVKLL